MNKILVKLGFDTSALSTYINQENLDLYTLATMSGDTLSYLQGSVQTGVKHTDALHYMDVDVNLRANNRNCSLTSSGGVTFSDKTITAYPFYDQQNFCPTALETFYTQKFLPKGSKYENMPLEQAYAQYYAEKIAEEVEQSIVWTGTTGSASGVKGLIAEIDSETTINGNTGGITVATGITDGNVVGIFKAMVKVIPAKFKGKAKAKGFEFVCGGDVFDMLIDAYFTLNNFHYSVAEAAYESGVVSIPAFGLNVRRLGGLTGTNRIFLTYKENYRVAVDLFHEEEDISVWYDQTLDQMFSRIKGKLGFKIVHPSEFVSFKLVP